MWASLTLVTGPGTPSLLTMGPAKAEAMGWGIFRTAGNNIHLDISTFRVHPEVYPEGGASLDIISNTTQLMKFSKAPERKRSLILNLKESIGKSQESSLSQESSASFQR